MKASIIFCLIASAFAFYAPKFTSRITKRNLFGSPQDNKPAPKKDQGMFGGMGNMMESMKKAQEIAKQAEVINKELADQIVTGKDASGAVTATYNGLSMPISMKIEESAMSMSAEELSTATTQAMVEGFKKAQGAMMQKMQALYSGAGVPPQQ
mmetsp:Transcript_26968/g.27211  ORF Transcript_26968/g.27211 Transcript_26968/m.27211 type:complete len:153 (+) Transcript_26968:68-526(+)|eukprot:CAMPEP_0182427220 /NCGR_PEP_ID=MMETSP1167-20130531/15972_1 /TAXON_ID=2988 /ORGANISM="Mallomonas Sp, Strain CCMP3275" /LENGTH=152 /DNA_ID=CAMNT_0024609297 /DNA_START=67 /DNA_END=525 /DNA_ORIENTATION=+